MKYFDTYIDVDKLEAQFNEEVHGEGENDKATEREEKTGNEEISVNGREAVNVKCQQYQVLLYNAVMTRW